MNRALEDAAQEWMSSQGWECHDDVIPEETFIAGAIWALTEAARICEAEYTTGLAVRIRAIANREDEDGKD